ncbi:MAG: hypothetical protein IJZ50_07685 [Alistipes sp.]|nr:hypothetical protein [Alistipes sp.]
MKALKYILLVVAMFTISGVSADYPERGDLARKKQKTMTVKEWKTTPDGRNRWIDHTETYNAKGQMIAEAEYSDFGRRMAWRSELSYNEKGQLTRVVIYNERNKVDKVRKYEYDENGVCVRRLNYQANGVLSSYRDFEFSYE